MLKQAFNIDQAVACTAIDSHLVGLYPIAVTPNLADDFDLESIHVDLDVSEDMHIHYRPCHISTIGAKAIEPAIGEEVCKDFLSDRIGLFVPFDDSECLSADGYESICSRIGELQSIFNLKNIIRMSDIFPRVEFDLQRKLNDGSVGCVSTDVYSLLMEYVGDSFPAYQALVAEQTEVFNSLFSCQYLPLHSIPNKVANQIGAAKVDGIGWCVDLFEEGTLEPFITYLAKSPSIAEIVKQHEIWCHYRQESCRRLLRAYEELMRDYQKWSSDTKH